MKIAIQNVSYRKSCELESTFTPVNKTAHYLRGPILLLLYTALIASVSGLSSTNATAESHNKLFVIQMVVLKISHNLKEFSEIRRTGPAADIAWKKAQSILGGRVQLLLDYVDVRRHQCEKTDYMGAIAAEIYYTRNVSVFIGPGCSEMLRVLCPMAARWNLPVVTGSGAGDFLGDKNEHATLTRTCPVLNTLCDSIVAVLRQFNWTTTGMMFDSVIPDLISKCIHSELYSNKVLAVSLLLEESLLNVTTILERIARETRGEYM